MLFLILPGCRLMGSLVAGDTPKPICVATTAEFRLRLIRFAAWLLSVAVILAPLSAMTNPMEHGARPPSERGTVLGPGFGKFRRKAKRTYYSRLSFSLIQRLGGFCDAWKWRRDQWPDDALRNCAPIGCLPPPQLLKTVEYRFAPSPVLTAKITAGGLSGGSLDGTMRSTTLKECLVASCTAHLSST